MTAQAESAQTATTTTASETTAFSQRSSHVSLPETDEGRRDDGATLIFREAALRHVRLQHGDDRLAEQHGAQQPETLAPPAVRRPAAAVARGRAGGRGRGRGQAGTSGRAALGCQVTGNSVPASGRQKKISFGFEKPAIASGGTVNTLVAFARRECFVGARASVRRC